MNYGVKSSKETLSFLLGAKGSYMYETDITIKILSLLLKN